MKRAILSVTNDLYTDARVDKVAMFLTRNGYEVTLVGRCYADSPELTPRAYHTHRMRLLFRKNWIFYAEYNLRLFFYLLFKKCDVFVANDLDTLLPNTLVSKLRRKRLVYDSHEYFCGELSVLSNPKALKVWKAIERYCFPKLKTVITVSQSIVDQYEQEYGIRPYLVRNIPPAGTPPLTHAKADLGMPTDKFNLIIQGNGLNEGRGCEESILAMQQLPDAHLFIIGGGTIIPKLHQMVAELQLGDRVTIVPRQTQEMLFQYTASADAGLAMDHDVGPNAQYSLPNKIFEYIKAGIPQIVSNLPERARIVRQYQIGLVPEIISPEAIAEAVRTLQSNPQLHQQYKSNCLKAAQELTWENEEIILKDIYVE